MSKNNPFIWRDDDWQIISKVTINVPDGEGVSQEQVQVKYRVLATDMVKDFFDESSAYTYADFINRAVIDVCGINNSAGDAIAWRDIAVKAVNFPFFADALVQGYFKAIGDLTAKNSSSLHSK